MGFILSLPIPPARGAEPAGLSPWSLASDWGEPGSVGWSPDNRSNVSAPWGFLGLRAGAFAVRDPLPGADHPEWGLREAGVPAAWYDSVATTIGEAGAWRGWNAPLASSEGFMFTPALGAARARLTVTGGGLGLDRDALDLTRASSRTVLRFGSTSMSRDGFARLGLAGEHVWFTSAETRTGRHLWSAAFVQRGLGNQLAPDGDPIGEGGRGESGRLGWDWQDSTHWSRLRIERAWDERHSLFLADRTFYSRRDAQSTGAEAEAGLLRGANVFDARFEARRERVRRSAVDAPSVVAVDDRGEWWWSALGWRRPLAGGRLDAQLGGGWHGTLRGADRAVQFAPGASWRRDAGPWRTRAYAERLLAPLWHDLAPGTPAFLQGAWVFGGEAALHAASARAAIGLVRGTVDERAIQIRYPIQDIVLRTGTAMDPDPYAFTLVSAELGADTGPLAWQASGWTALVRGSDPQLDPESGARADVTARTSWFTGDLGVRLRLGGAWVGPHDLQPIGAAGGILRAEGFVTASAELGLTLADVTFTLRGTNLENARHPEQWADPATLERSRSGGRQMLSELTWQFTN